MSGKYEKLVGARATHHHGAWGNLLSAKSSFKTTPSFHQVKTDYTFWNSAKLRSSKTLSLVSDHTFWNCRWGRLTRWWTDWMRYYSLLLYCNELEVGQFVYQNQVIVNPCQPLSTLVILSYLPSWCQIVLLAFLVSNCPGSQILNIRTRLALYWYRKRLRREGWNNCHLPSLKFLTKTTKDENVPNTCCVCCLDREN